MRYYFFLGSKARPLVVRWYAHLEEKLRLVLSLSQVPVGHWPAPRLPLNLSGDTAQLTLADGRAREQVAIHRWWLRIDDSDRWPYDRPRIDLDADVHDDVLPYGTHLVAADLPASPATCGCRHP